MIKERVFTVEEIIKLIELCNKKTKDCPKEGWCPFQAECLFWWTGDDSLFENKDKKIFEKPIDK